MKLDKRACRHAANVPLHISLNAGVLYTERVKYLVTAAVKLLGGHRVLAVYFYECERLKANDRMPKWVVFQGKDDFVRSACAAPSDFHHAPHHPLPDAMSGIFSVNADDTSYA